MDAPSIRVVEYLASLANADLHSDLAATLRGTDRCGPWRRCMPRLPTEPRRTDSNLTTLFWLRWYIRAPW